MKKGSSNIALKVLGAGLAITALFGFKRGYITIGAPSGSFTNGEISEALNLVKNLYGKKYAQDIERAIRLETRHFDSAQWKQGNSAGMEAKKNTWPYGWGSLAEFINEYPELDLSQYDFMTYSMQENGTGITKVFIRFPDVYSFVLFMAWFIWNKRGGNVSNWYSLDPEDAAQYAATLNTITPEIVNNL